MAVNVTLKCDRCEKVWSQTKDDSTNILEKAAADIRKIAGDKLE